MRWFWVDRFTEFVCKQHAKAVKNISLGEPHVHDHFDGYGIMPNSLIIEGIAQTGGLLVSECHGFERIVVLGKVPRCQFHFAARPGDTLVYRTEIDHIRDEGAVVHATSHVSDRLQAEVEVFFANLGNGDGIIDGPPPQLFEREDLLSWLMNVDVFKVGCRQDGSPLAAADYRYFDGVAD